MAEHKYRWWHGLLFYAGVQATSLLLNKIARSSRNGDTSTKDQEQLYREERLPVFAPPTVAFPIAWTINSVSAIAGGLYVLNLPRNTDGRARFLQLQAGAWALYSMFQAAYFGLRSPINAELVTVMYSAVTCASAQVAVSKMKSPKVALSLAPTLAWLALANPVGITVAAWNHDPFWKLGPFIEPKPRWVKNSSPELVEVQP